MSSTLLGTLKYALLIRTKLRHSSAMYHSQVTVIQPGGFRTGVLDATNKETNENVVYTHPAYTNPALPSVYGAQALKRFDLIQDKVLIGDPEKLISVLFKLADMKEVPFRLPLGKDALANLEARKKADQAEQEKFGWNAWSDDLLLIPSV